MNETNDNKLTPNKKHQHEFVNAIKQSVEHQFVRGQVHLKTFYYNLGVSCLKLKTQEKAIKDGDIKEILETNIPDFKIATAEIGYAQKAAGKFKSAKECIDSAKTWTAVKEIFRYKEQRTTTNKVQKAEAKKRANTRKEKDAGLRKSYKMMDLDTLGELMTEKADLLMEIINEDVKATEDKKSMIELTLKLKYMAESFGVIIKESEHERVKLLPSERINKKAVDLSDMEEMLSKKEEDENEKVSAGLDLQGANITA